MPQTSVSDNPAVGFAGMLVDSSESDVASYVSEEAAAEIPFGVMVQQGTADTQALLIAAQADVPIGVVVHSHAYAKDDELGDTGLKPDVTLGILKRGVIWVTAIDAVTPADDVRYTEAGGGFLTTAAGGVTVDCSTFARFLTTAGVGELVQLEIDMTGRAGRTSD